MSNKKSGGPEKYLTQRVKEAIVGAIVNSGIREATDVVKVLKELQNMHKKAQSSFHDSVHDMIARGVGKRAPIRKITWALLDKAIAKDRVVRQTTAAEESRDKKMHALKKRQERSRARSRKRLARRRRSSMIANANATTNLTQVAPKRDIGSPPPTSPSKRTLKKMRRARKNRVRMHQKIKSVLSHGKVLKLLKSNGEKLEIIAGITEPTGAAATGGANRNDNSSDDEIEIELDDSDEDDDLDDGAVMEASELVLELCPGKLGIVLDEVDGMWCMVMSVVPNQQAAIAGFVEGDCITSIGGSHIPEGVNAVGTVKQIFQTMPRPCSVTILREGLRVPKLPPKVFTVQIAEGAIGFSAEESSTGHCILTHIVEGGQAEVLGLFERDRIIQIGDTKIVGSDMAAYDTAMQLLQSTQKPFYLHLERDMRRIGVSLHPGSLGISLAEIDDTKCMISGLKDGGQGDQMGLEEGDTVLSVGGNLIPEGKIAYDAVVSYLQSLPRPLEFVVLREGY